MTFQPPRLGPGAIYLRSLDGVFRSNAGLIEVAEIEPQTLWTKSTAPGSLPRGSDAEIGFITGLPQRLLTHGVGYPIGGTICDQQLHIPEFHRWTDALGSRWTSEHLSILDVRGRHGDHACGFLMPPLQTDAQVRLAAQNIIERREALGLPFAFETGVNYFARRKGEMPDGEFFAAVAEAADCGILLDLTNLWVNDRNGREKIGDVLARLPLERVWEVHLAGIEFAHGFWLDAHSRGIDPELAELAADVIGSLPNLGTIIFEMAPDRVSPFGPDAFLREMERVNRLWQRVPQTPAARFEPVASQAGSCPGPTPEAWERLIAERMFPAAERPVGDAEILTTTEADERSFSLYSELAASFRAGTVAELLANTMRLLLLGLGERRLRELMDHYTSTTLPAVYPTDEALCFRQYLADHALTLPGLEEMLPFEAALVEAAANSATLQISVARDIDTMLSDIAAGRLPGPSSECAPMTLEIGVDPAPFVRVLQPQSA